MEKKTTKTCGQKLGDYLIGLEDKSVYFSSEDICKMFGLDAKFSKDKEKCDQIVAYCRDYIYGIGYVLTNRRNVGWKVAVKFEATDEKIKACHRVLSRIVGLQKNHLNKLLTYSDIASNPVEEIRHSLAIEFSDTLGEFIEQLSNILKKDPKSKDAENQVEKTEEREV